MSAARVFSSRREMCRLFTKAIKVETKNNTETATRRQPFSLETNERRLWRVPALAGGWYLHKYVRGGICRTSHHTPIIESNFVVAEVGLDFPFVPSIS